MDCHRYSLERCKDRPVSGGDGRRRRRRCPAAGDDDDDDEGPDGAVDSAAGDDGPGRAVRGSFDVVGAPALLEFRLRLGVERHAAPLRHVGDVAPFVAHALAHARKNNRLAELERTFQASSLKQAIKRLVLHRRSQNSQT